MRDVSPGRIEKKRTFGRNLSQKKHNVDNKNKPPKGPNHAANRAAKVQGRIAGRMERRGRDMSDPNVQARLQNKTAGRLAGGGVRKENRKTSTGTQYTAPAGSGIQKVNHPGAGGVTRPNRSAGGGSTSPKKNQADVGRNGIAPMPMGTVAGLGGIGAVAGRGGKRKQAMQAPQGQPGQGPAGLPPELMNLMQQYYGGGQALGAPPMAGWGGMPGNVPNLPGGMGLPGVPGGMPPGPPGGAGLLGGKTGLPANRPTNNMGGYGRP